MYSATQTLALKEWKVEFIKMFNHKPLLVSDSRSLLSCCTVLVLATLQACYKLLSAFLRYRICTTLEAGVSIVLTHVLMSYH